MKKNYSLLITGIIALSINSIHAQCPVPSGVTASPSSLCAGSSTSLNATAALHSINWYTVPSAGIPIGSSLSGVNYATTPIVTTTYYAESYAIGTITLNYTGGVQSYTVPGGTTSLTVDIRGAKGGDNSPILGGFGGRTQAVISVTPGQVLQFYVGGQGISSSIPGSGGYNGGGNTLKSFGSGISGTGGGSTDIRISPYGIANRIVIAGGGGGAGQSPYAGAHGGGLIGQDAVAYPGWPSSNGKGGTQIAGGGAGNGALPSYLCTPGSLFQGGTGDGDNAGSGAGGGGFYGGGGGMFCGGGGGSSYTIPGATSVIHTQGYQNGNGQVIITGTGCVSISRTAVTVTVNALPTVSVTSGGACPGSSFTMTPSGASTYTFSSGSAVVSPTATTNYSVTGTSSLGCVSSNTAVSTVTISATPTVSVTSGAICSGQSFTMVASGASTYNYSGGAAVVSPTATTNYNVTGTSSVGCVSSNTAVSTVTVNASPTISASASSAIICAGEATTLSATASSTTYTWNTGATTASLSVSPTTTTNYTVITTGTNGCTGTANVNVTVNACTGINEVTASLISVYPNPNNGIVNITLTAALAQNATLEIYDALGKLVVKQVLANELNAVNMSNLENGVYVFKVLNNNNTVKIGKLIKQ